METSVLVAIIASIGGVLTGTAMIVSAIITARKDTRTGNAEVRSAANVARNVETDSLRSTIETLTTENERLRKRLIEAEHK